MEMGKEKQRVWKGKKEGFQEAGRGGKEGWPGEKELRIEREQPREWVAREKGEQTEKEGKEVGWRETGERLQES